MITAFVQFKLPRAMTPEQAREVSSSAPRPATWACPA
jgi:hypothetical protein